MSVSESPEMESLAEYVQDLQQIVALLLKGQPRAKPWQRQLVAHLVDVDRHVQVLRLTMSLDRPEVEVLQASEGLEAASRLLTLAVSGSRVDLTTRAALRLVADLAARVHRALAIRAP